MREPKPNDAAEALPDEMNREKKGTFLDIANKVKSHPDSSPNPFFTCGFKVTSVPGYFTVASANSLSKWEPPGAGRS